MSSDQISKLVLSHIYKPIYIPPHTFFFSLIFFSESMYISHDECNSDSTGPLVHYLSKSIL